MENLGNVASGERIAVHLNDDPGSGLTYGFYMQKNIEAKKIFDDRRLEALRVADAFDVEDVRQSAVVLAIFAWHAARRDERIPR